MSKEKRQEAKLLEVTAMYLPAKESYDTAKIYCEVFDLDPNASEQFPLKEESDKMKLSVGLNLRSIDTIESKTFKTYILKTNVLVF